jgi:hypothetical protein
MADRRHWSYSALNNFTNCPRKFHAYDIAKVVKEPENEAMKEGYRIHKILADYFSDRALLPPELIHHHKLLRTMTSGLPREKVLTEHRMACTFKLEPCEYFDKTKRVWLRAVADLLVLNGGDRALSVDWKTGKEPDERYELLPKNFQLRLTAVCIFLHFPQIRHITSRYVYLNAGTQPGFEMVRDELREFLPQMYEYAGVYQRAIRHEHFPPRPSGLCKRHCAVATCEFHGKGG